MSTEVRRRRRRAPSRRGAAPHWLAQLPYLIVLSGVGAGLTLCAFNYFRKGSGLMAAALLLGALARLLLPESQLGPLAVRSRSIDCWTLVILGEMVAFVSLSVPPMNKPGLALAGAFGVLILLAMVARGARLLITGRRDGPPPSPDAPAPPGPPGPQPGASSPQPGASSPQPGASSPQPGASSPPGARPGPPGPPGPGQV